MCALFLYFISAGIGVGYLTSVHREESPYHTLRILGKYIVLDLFLLIMQFIDDYAWI